MLLDKFLYGLKQSPLKFQLHLDKILRSIGYQPTINDPCVYIKHQQQDFSILSVHVDDILQVTTNDALVTDLHQQFVKEFQSITYHEQATSYLGINIQREGNSKQIFLSQNKLVNQIIKEYSNDSVLDQRRITMPAGMDLFQYQSSKPNSITKTKYLSLLMSLMFLARMTRPDILLTVSYLATKVNTSSMEDWNRALRVVHYLKTTTRFI